MSTTGKVKGFLSLSSNLKIFIDCRVITIFTEIQLNKTKIVLEKHCVNCKIYMIVDKAQEDDFQTSLTILYDDKSSSQLQDQVTVH